MTMSIRFNTEAGKMAGRGPMNASFTHMYAPGTRRHIASALKLGATMEEIMEVLKLCVAQGVQVSNLDVPILAEQPARG